MGGKERGGGNFWTHLMYSKSCHAPLKSHIQSTLQTVASRQGVDYFHGKIILNATRKKWILSMHGKIIIIRKRRDSTVSA